MWQEARKQEKKLRCIMIDYKKRAERRQAYYARMRMDPHQLMRIYGQKCKFHMIGENANVNTVDGQLMPWQGDPEILIDRFDVRAHLDWIPEETIVEEEKSEEETKLERKCNYESYRTLVQVDATGASEEQYLKQLDVEETISRTEQEKRRLMDNEKNSSKAKAKIHYKYDDSTNRDDESEDDESDSSESDGELSDIDINVNVLDLSIEQTNHLDALATQYGVGYGQYCKQLLLEKKEFEYVKKLEEEEEERAKMPGRKGKSARRRLRAKQKTLRGSPLSFALHEASPSDDERNQDSTSSDSSCSQTAVNSKVEFITEFGGEVEESASKNGAEIVQPTSPPDSRTKASSERASSRHKHSKNRSRSRSRSASGHRHKHSSRHSRSSHGSHGDSDKQSSHRDEDSKHKSRSRSRERHKSRHSRSRSRDRHSKHSTHRRDDRSSRSRLDSSRTHSSHSSHRSRSKSPISTSSHRSRSSSHRSRSRSPKNKENDNNYTKSRKDRDRSQDDSRKHSERSDHSRKRSHSRSRSNSKTRTSAKDDCRRKSKSGSRSSSREEKEKSPHESVVKRLGTQVLPTAVVVVDKSKLTPREKMKMRMQKLLNRQIKCDKKVEHKKQVAKEQETEERDMEIYEMSRMMRQKEREKKVYRSPSPKGRMPSYDASRFRYVREESKEKSSSPK